VDQEVVKRSGRDEPLWVITHMCMETMLVISLCNYLYLKLAKMLHLLSLMLSLQQNQRTGEQNRFWQEVGGGGVAK
jgi:hypothetical protein